MRIGTFSLASAIFSTRLINDVLNQGLSINMKKCYFDPQVHAILEHDADNDDDFKFRS